MNPQVRHAQRACEAAKARQAVIVWFDEAGQFAVASYGETKAECAAVKPTCNAIADAIDAGELPCPGDGHGRRRPHRRQNRAQGVKERARCGAKCWVSARSLTSATGSATPQKRHRRRGCEARRRSRGGSSAAASALPL